MAQQPAQQSTQQPAQQPEVLGAECSDIVLTQELFQRNYETTMSLVQDLIEQNNVDSYRAGEKKLNQI